MRDDTRDRVEDEQTQDPEIAVDDTTSDETSDDEATSAKTRAGSNLPNAAGHRGDGTHE
jgi:hypothetical protein